MSSSFLRASIYNAQKTVTCFGHKTRDNNTPHQKQPAGCYKGHEKKILLCP
jgi:hypothetical protein